MAVLKTSTVEVTGRSLSGLEPAGFDSSAREPEEAKRDPKGTGAIGQIIQKKGTRMVRKENTHRSAPARRGIRGIVPAILAIAVWMVTPAVMAETGRASDEEIREALERVAAALGRDGLSQEDAEELESVMNEMEAASTAERAASDAEMREALDRVAEVVGRQRLAAKQAERPESPGDSYRLSVRDRVQFNVQGENDLNTEQRIDGNGRIRVPLLRNVVIEGMTAREAEAHIEALYIAEEIFRDPEVTLRITEYAPKHAYVLGQVSRPGEVEFPVEVNSVDIVQLISMAGGFTRIARADRVSVTRAGEEGDEDTFQVDVRDLYDGRGRGDSGRERLRIYPGDIIFVPERIL